MNMASADAATALALAAPGKGTVAPYFIFRTAIADALQKCTGCYRREVNRLASSQAGTVHTSQGREADVVFIVLGSRAGKRGEGSRSWVNGSPNLLNVAVSRAKRRVYVVGNLADWKNGTYTSRIAKDLPVEASAEN